MLDSGKIIARSPERGDGAGGLIPSVPGAHGTRTLPSPGGEQSPGLPLSPVGLH